MSKEIKEKLVRYLLSSLVTFISAFLGSLAVFMDSATSFGDMGLKSAISASVFVAIRALVKYIAELLPEVRF
jgi:site-specific DNA-adenine methylase